MHVQAMAYHWLQQRNAEEDFARTGKRNTETDIIVTGNEAKHCVCERQLTRLLILRTTDGPDCHLPEPARIGEEVLFSRRRTDRVEIYAFRV